jgi:hypothetical protein
MRVRHNVLGFSASSVYNARKKLGADQLEPPKSERNSSILLQHDEDERKH